MDIPDWVERNWSKSPSKGDLLFPTPKEWSGLTAEEKGDRRASASLHVKDNIDDYAYTQGYRLGGRILANYVIEHHRDENFLVYPIVFAYRHHIELRFKRLIPVGASLLDRPLNADEERKLQKTHRIDLLWKMLQPRVKALCKISSEELAGIDSYVKQLSKVDEKSQSFRYAMDTKGDPHLADLRHINIQRFAELMERLANYLEGMDYMFDDMYDTKCQMIADAAPDFFG